MGKQRRTRTALAAPFMAHAASSGTIWVMDGNAPPADTGCDAESFAAGLVDGPSPVRVLGFRQNAALIASLYRRRLHSDGLVVEVGRPVVAQWELLDDAGPAHVLLELKQLAVQCPTSMGGWHPLTEREYAGYVLTSWLANGPVDQHHLDSMLYKHAAWPALSFITHLDKQSLANVLSEIGDPRWFLDPERPDSLSRLRSYFGLPPACGGASTKRRARRDLLRSTWQNPCDDESTPGAFLWRYWRAQRTSKYADLATTQYFLSYLRHSWLDSLCGDAVRRYVRLDRGVLHDQGLFIPEHFFRTPAESATYREHMSVRSRFDQVTGWT